MYIFEKIIIGLIALVIVVAGFLMVRFNDRLDACDAVGGTMVKTADGWTCFKMVRIEKTT